MPLYEIYNYNVTVKYKSTLCSRAMFFVVLTTIITFLFPLVVAYRSRGFWLKNYEFYEQPDVTFKYRYAIIAQSDDPTYAIACGHMPEISKFYHLEDCAEIEVQEVDNSLDRKMDEIQIKITAQNVHVKNVHSINVLFVFDYKLRGTCPLQMETLIMHRQEFSLPVAEYFLTANLNLNQVAPLPCWRNQIDIRFNDSVVPEDISDVDWLQDLIYSYSRRNVSTSLNNKYTLNKSGVSPLLQVKTSVAIPEHKIRYKPGLWQELKHSWQQYLSIALIFYWIMNKIKMFVFVNNMIPTWVNSPWKKLF